MIIDNYRFVAIINRYTKCMFMPHTSKCLDMRADSPLKEMIRNASATAAFNKILLSLIACSWLLAGVI